MGYYAEITESNFRIDESNLDKAYERMCKLNDRDDLKSGGSSTGERWFSWMESNYPEVYDTAEAILNALGFQTDLFTFGTGPTELYIIGYDNKVGDEEKFLAAICDLAEPNSAIEWRGEDGQLWKIEYGGNEPVEYSAKVEWIPTSRV